MNGRSLIFRLFRAVRFFRGRENMASERPFAIFPGEMPL